jgi:hypothetical protein
MPGSGPVDRVNYFCAKGLQRSEKAGAQQTRMDMVQIVIECNERERERRALQY